MPQKIFKSRRKTSCAVMDMMSAKDLQRFFKYTIKEAANKLQVSESTLKVHCRLVGIQRWPRSSRKLRLENWRCTSSVCLPPLDKINRSPVYTSSSSSSSQTASYAVDSDCCLVLMNEGDSSPFLLDKTDFVDDWHSSLQQFQAITPIKEGTLDLSKDFRNDIENSFTLDYFAEALLSLRNQ